MCRFSILTVVIYTTYLSYQFTVVFFWCIYCTDWKHEVAHRWKWKRKMSSDVHPVGPAKSSRWLAEPFPITINVYNARFPNGFDFGRPDTYARQKRHVLPRSGKFIIYKQSWRFLILALRDLIFKVSYLKTYFRFFFSLFQALFSLVVWPFSLKLFWAPLVDALYVQRIGRRKSWLVPVQYLMGKCKNIVFFYHATMK